MHVCEMWAQQFASCELQLNQSVSWELWLRSRISVHYITSALSAYIIWKYSYKIK